MEDYQALSAALLVRDRLHPATERHPTFCRHGSRYDGASLFWAQLLVQTWSCTVSYPETRHPDPVLHSLAAQDSAHSIIRAARFDVTRAR